MAKYTVVWKKEHTGGSSSLDVSPPIINGDSVYILGFQLLKVDLKTGTEAWSKILINENNPESYRKMLLTSNAVFASKSDKVKAFRKSNGGLMWETDTGIASDETDPFKIAPYLMEHTSNRIFFAHEQNLIGLSQSTGNQEIKVTLDTTVAGKGLQQIVAFDVAGNVDSPLFIGTQYTNEGILNSGGRIMAFESDDGSSIWEVDISTMGNDSTVLTPTNLVLTDNFVVVLTNDEVIALEPDSGNLMWQTSPGDENSSFSYEILYSDSAIFVSTFSGDILRLNSTDGTIEWRASGEEDLFTLIPGSMAVDEGRLYYPKLSVSGFSIRVIDSANGETIDVITSSDIKNVGFDFDFFGGMAVQKSYLIQQGSINAYGIQLLTVISSTVNSDAGQSDNC